MMPGPAVRARDSEFARLHLLFAARAGGVGQPGERYDAREFFRTSRLAFDSVATAGTPRRLVLKASRLQERQEDIDEEVMGPSAKAAFGAQTNHCLGTQTLAAGVYLVRVTCVQADGSEVSSIQKVAIIR